MHRPFLGLKIPLLLGKVGWIEIFGYLDIVELITICSGKSEFSFLILEPDHILLDFFTAHSVEVDLVSSVVGKLLTHLFDLPNSSFIDRRLGFDLLDGVGLALGQVLGIRLNPVVQHLRNGLTVILKLNLFV